MQKGKIAEHSGKILRDSKIQCDNLESGKYWIIEMLPINKQPLHNNNKQVIYNNNKARATFTSVELKQEVYLSQGGVLCDHKQARAEIVPYTRTIYHSEKHSS